MAMGLAERRAREALQRISGSSRPEAWISVRPEAELLREAFAADERLAAGESLPLAGLVFAVKDNIDVEGLPTTAAHPAFSRLSLRSAPAVRALVAAGAICAGKTNMDQFATGLVGTRSPYGAVRHAFDEDRISGGSSSGSAVVVANGEADFALGTDTAGSGRVPAAFHGIVGVKPSLGIVASDGMLPAAKPYDTVSVFARELSLAARVFQTILADPVDELFLSAPLAAPSRPLLAVPDPAGLEALCSEAAEAFTRAKDLLAAAGACFAEIDMAPFFSLAELLYDSALVSERSAAFGRAVRADDDGWDPSVAAIAGQGMAYSAVDFIDARERMTELSGECHRALARTAGLLLPTVSTHPTIAEVQADPLGVNRGLGRYTNFVNLMGLAAVAVPVPGAASRRFGVTLATPHGHDAVGLDLASRLLGEPWALRADIGHDIAVFGAHLRGQPANAELEVLGARYLEDVSLPPRYRMVRLDTDPPKPGIEFSPEPSPGIQGELWRVPSARVARFLRALPEPMTLGPITLDDGRIVTGFGFRGGGAAHVDISGFRRWDAYLAGAG